jgi:hypothetical protein
MFGLLALLAVAAAIAWAVCAASRRELYRGPASAIYNNMPHYSATTRTIFVVLHREVPELQSASLVAELPLAECEALFAGNKMRIVPVDVSVVKSRCSGVRTYIV